MADAKALKAKFAANAEARKVDVEGFRAAVDKYGDRPDPKQGARVSGIRVIRRSDDVTNRDANGLGVALFDAPGLGVFSQDGTTDVEGFTHWLSGHPKPDSGFLANYPGDGLAEVEILTSKGWLNCLTGEPNSEKFVHIDGIVDRW